MKINFAEPGAQDKTECLYLSGAGPNCIFRLFLSSVGMSVNMQIFQYQNILIVSSHRRILQVRANIFIVHGLKQMV
jgi:hypothetical protein